MSASLSPEEWEKVVKFGFDQPEVDDVEGMTFPGRLVATAAVVGVVGFVGVLAVVLAVVL